MALSLPNATFDVAVMPLVIFFLAVPSTGVAEMARVVVRGGLVAAYAWDMSHGGFPYATLFRAMGEMGLTVPAPPSPEASRRDTLRDLWTGAGLEAVDTTEISVERTFADFTEYWTTILGAASVGAQLRGLSLPLARSLARARLGPQLMRGRQLAGVTVRRFPQNHQ